MPRVTSSSRDAPLLSNDLFKQEGKMACFLIYKVGTLLRATQRWAGVRREAVGKRWALPRSRHWLPRCWDAGRVPAWFLETGVPLGE